MVRLTQHITQLFNKIQKLPNDWKLSDIILIHRKGSRQQIANYRPISLSPIIAKIFSKSIELRIRNILTQNQSQQEAGFRKTFSTIDHLRAINQLIEKSQEYNIDIHLLAIDYSKAFDSVTHTYLIQASKNQGVPINYVNIIKDLYNELKARIKTDINGTYFNIDKGGNKEILYPQYSSTVYWNRPSEH